MISSKLTSFTSQPAKTVGDNTVGTSPGELLRKTGIILYSNRHIPPLGYSYNEEGWVLTNTEVPYYNVMLPRFVGNHVNVAEVFLQDLLVLTHLNDKPLRVLSTALASYFNKYNYFLEKEVIEEMEAIVIQVNDMERVPPVMEREIFRYENLWIASWCTLGGRAQVKIKRRRDYIGDIRSYMDIDRKYITKHVMEDANVSRYSANDFWRFKKWSKEDRTLNTVLEATHDLHQRGIGAPTRKQIAEISGLSVSTVNRRIKRLAELKE